MVFLQPGAAGCSQFFQDHLTFVPKCQQQDTLFQAIGKTNKLYLDFKSTANIDCHLQFNIASKLLKVDNLMKNYLNRIYHHSQLVWPVWIPVSCLICLYET